MPKQSSLLFLVIFLLLILCLPAFAKPEDEFWSAVQKGDYSSAAKSAREIGATTPEYYLLAAICYQNESQYSECAIYKNKFQRRGNPASLKEILSNQESSSQGNPQVLLLEGMATLLFPEMQLGEARDFLEKAGAKLKDNPYYYNYLALNKINNRNYSNAVQKYLQKAIGLKKNFPEPYTNLAVVLAQNKETEKAIAVLLDCLANCPEAPANTYESIINLTSSPVVLTIKPFGQAIVISAPGLKEQYRQKIRAGLANQTRQLLNLAEFFILKGNAVSARGLLDGYNYNSSAFYSYLRLQMANLDGNAAEVAALGHSLLENNELDYRRLFEAGNIFFYAKDFPMAVSFYNNSLKSANSEDDLTLAGIHANLGACFYLTKDYQKALENTEQALKYDEKDAISLVNLGLTYRELRDPGKAVESFRKALEFIQDPEWRREIQGMIDEIRPPEQQPQPNPEFQPGPEPADNQEI